METKQYGWVVQNNLTSDRYVYENFIKIFEKYKIPYELVEVIPFHDELPKFNRSRPNIFYGSTTMMNNVYNDKSINQGLFFNPETFRMDLYIQKWGDLMLNNKARVSTFNDIIKENHKDDELFFIRPVDDSKLFTGTVKTFEEIKDWQKNTAVIKDGLLTEDTPILIGEPYKINKEWRNIIVNGKVISSSRYYKDGYLNKSAIDIPSQVIDLCEKACSIFTPHDVFAMDIAETGGEYYILECGCFNSVGFYDIDMEKVILAIDEYFQNIINKKFTLSDLKDAYLNGWYDREIGFQHSKEKIKPDNFMKLYLNYKSDEVKSCDSSRSRTENV